MRRTDREIKDLDAIIQVMEKCDVCRIALNDEEGYPYIVPLNFGMEAVNDKITLYFHGAAEGRKYELMKKDNRVGFEMDCSQRLVPDMEKKMCTMEYESVIGCGHIELVPEEEKYEAICIMMKHYHQEEFPFHKAVVPKTTVYKMIVESISGKANVKY